MLTIRLLHNFSDWNLWNHYFPCRAASLITGRGDGGGGGGLLSWTPKKVHAKVFHPKKVKMQISIPKRALHLPVTIISEYPPIPLLGNTHTVMGFLNGSGKLSLIYCCPAFLTRLQSWTKLLRHTSFRANLCTLLLCVPPSPFQCCFNLQNHLARMTALYQATLYRGEGGKLISCSVFTDITLKSANFARNVL